VVVGRFGSCKSAVPKQRADSSASGEPAFSDAAAGDDSLGSSRTDDHGVDFGTILHYDEVCHHRRPAVGEDDGEGAGAIGTNGVSGGGRGVGEISENLTGTVTVSIWVRSPLPSNWVIATPTCWPMGPVPPNLAPWRSNPAGDKDSAFKWLDKAYQERDGESITLLKCDPGFKDLRGDPRFANLLRRMGLPA
jgi:hypothetical protein